MGQSDSTKPVIFAFDVQADGTVTRMREFFDAKPLLGTGEARPVGFTRPPSSGLLLACTDGFCNYIRRETLLRFAELEPTALERKEKLEQLRALENGIGIAVVTCDGAPPLAVDTEKDLGAVRQALDGLVED